MGNDFISLKSRFQNAKGAPPRATDAPKADMGVHAKTASDHRQPAYRVEKLSASIQKRRSQHVITLTDRFKDTIHTYRSEVDLETDRLLAQTENDLNKQLNHIIAEFGGQLNIAADYENNIFRPISEERLEIISSSPEKNGQAWKQHAALADRMHEFERIVSEISALLEILWKEWHATNLKLVCLAMEVLGPDGVELAFNQHDDGIAAQMNAAVDAYRENEARRTDFKEQAAAVERSVRTTAKETINNLNEQERVRWLRVSGMAYTANLLPAIQEWKINEKKKIQKIKQIMMEAD